MSCYVWACCVLFVRSFAEKTLLGTWTSPMCSLMSSPQQSGRIMDNVVLVWRNLRFGLFVVLSMTSFGVLRVLMLPIVRAPFC